MKKIIIQGKLVIQTGLHIGGDNSFSEIGALDSPVIRNLATGKPLIPGSSLKGKIRSLLTLNEQGESVDFIHEKPRIQRLFGSDTYRSRLQFFDLNLEGNPKVLTEVKYENTINRKTGVANPRQIERVIPQTIFHFNLVYNQIDENDFNEDILMMTKGLKLLQSDYLGGGGTRGNGRVRFEALQATCEDTIDLSYMNSLLTDVCLFGKKLYDGYEK